MVVKGAALLLVPLMQGASADWTTTIKANLIVSNGLAPVVDYVATPPLRSPSPAVTPQTSISSSFDHARSHREQLTSVVTVPDGKVPTIHFSPILSVGTPEPSAREPSTPPAVPLSSSPSVPPVRTSVSTPVVSSLSPSSSVPVAPSSSAPSVPPRTRSNTPSSMVSVAPPSSSAGARSAPDQPSSTPVPPGSPEPSSESSPPTGASSSSPNNPSSASVPRKSTPFPGGTSSGTGPSPSTSPGQQATTPGQLPSSGSPGFQTTPAGGSVPSVAPSDQLTSAGLASASDLNSLSADPTGSNSAIGDYLPTASPSTEPWRTLTALPSGTITGTPAYTDASNIAALLRNSYNNIDDLKKDPESYRKHIEEVQDQSENYLSKTNYDSSKSPCASSKKRKRDLFSAIGNLASEAADATVNTAKSIADAAISCVKPIADEITSEIPDVPEDVTVDIENKIKKGTEYFDEISNIVTEMENKANDNDDNEDDDSSSSGSSTSSCSSSTTYSDCSWTTILSSTISTGDDGSATPSTSTTSTETCNTETACNASPTTMSTTTTIKACTPRRRISGTAAPGYSGSIPVTSSVSSTTPPNPGSTSPPPASSRGSRTTSGVTSPKMTPTSPATASCATESFTGAHTTQTFCVCNGGPAYDPVVSTYSVPRSGTKCSDFRTFPTAGLIHVPAEPAHPQICNNPTPDDPGKPGWCKCKKDNLVQWAPLPHIQGTNTVLEGNCQAISTISFSTPTVAPPKTVTDYTYVDPMERSSMYEDGVVITTDYGIGPATMTVGISEPTEVYIPAFTSTLANSDVELIPAKTIENEDSATTTIATEPTIISTHAAEGQCKYVEGSLYNIYIIWDIFDWSAEEQDFASLASAFKGRLEDRACGVTNFQWKEFVDSYGPAFSFNTAEWQDTCVQDAIHDVGGPDTLCQHGDFSGSHWWTENDSIAGLLAHAQAVDTPHSSYEAQVTGA